LLVQLQNLITIKYCFYTTNGIKPVIGSYETNRNRIDCNGVRNYHDVVPFIIISLETHGESHNELAIFYILLSIGFFFFIFSFPIKGGSKKDKNLKT
jgi:hypothetical protein